MIGHAAGWLHATSHPHDAAQSTDGHAPEPRQRTTHSPGPQLTLPHDAGPEHLTSQLSAAAQSTLPHAPPLLQRISQS